MEHAGLPRNHHEIFYESAPYKSGTGQTGHLARFMFLNIGTRFPESPIPSRVLIAIGPGAPPRGQLQGGHYRTISVVHCRLDPEIHLLPKRMDAGVKPAITLEWPSISSECVRGCSDDLARNRT